MSSNLQLTLNAETSFEFELQVSGIKLSEAKVRFGLEKNGVTFQFPCKQKNGKWNVVVPALDSFGLKEGLYSHTIELISNGYYFAPVTGTAEVTAAAEVTGSIVKKDVKVAVSGIKVTETKVSKRKPIKKNILKRPLTEREQKRLDEQNKFNTSSKGKTRLQKLAGI